MFDFCETGLDGSGLGARLELGLEMRRMAKRSGVSSCKGASQGSCRGMRRKLEVHPQDIDKGNTL